MPAVLEKTETLAEAETAAEATAWIKTVRKDLREAASAMGPEEARYLVDYYYQHQDQRKAADNRLRSMAEEPTDTILKLSAVSGAMETTVRGALARYAGSSAAGRWALMQHGVGPVITAGCLAYIDVNKSKHASSVWRFAGLDPTSKWEKGKKRPWCAQMKQIAFHAGDCFVKFHNDQKCFYGGEYERSKVYYQKRNDAGEYADDAARILTEKNWKKGTEARKAYEAGRLPDGQIHARARRWAAKLFLGHFWNVRRLELHGIEPELPYWVAHGEGGGHDAIAIPHFARWRKEEGL